LEQEWSIFARAEIEEGFFAALRMTAVSVGIGAERTERRTYN